MSGAVAKKLTPSVVAQAEALLDEGRHTPGAEWREPRSGFFIRFGVASASFLLHTEQKTVTLARVGAVSAQTARILAEQTKLALRDGRDAREFIKTYLERISAGAAQGDAHIAAVHASARSRGRIYDAERPWKLSRLLERFVDHKVKNDLKEGGRWARQYGRYLDDPALADLRDKRVCDLTYADLFSLKRALTPAGRTSARSARILRQLIAALQWGRDEEAVNTGLINVEPFWATLKVSYQSKKRTRAPDSRQIARMLIVLERHSALEVGRLSASLCLKTLARFVLQTGQRDGMVVTLRRENILPHPDRGDWAIAHWTAEATKGGRETSLAHMIPVPASLVEALKTMWRQVDPENLSEWAFPMANRPTRHMNQSALNELWGRMDGRLPATSQKPLKPAYEGKPGPKPKHRMDRAEWPNLFDLYLEEGYFVFHDARRSLSNFLGNEGLGRAASALLGHRMQTDIGALDEEDFAARMSNTTSKYYFTAQQLSLKTRGMALWSEAFEAALEDERRSFKIHPRFLTSEGDGDNAG
jgi:integrase